MNIQESQDAIIAEFSIYDDWMEKYNYLIELSKELEMYPDNRKLPENLIKGCQSRVWLDAELKEGQVIFMADSDAIITKGIVALLLRVYNFRTLDEILQTDPAFIDEIGLKENLSPTRANGLVSMVKQIKMYALAYKTKLNKTE